MYNLINLRSCLFAKGNQTLGRFLCTLQLPKNLTAVEMNVFSAPKPKAVTNAEYFFPKKLGRLSTVVRPFAKPASSPVETLDLNPKIFGVAIRRDIVTQVIRYQRAKLRQPQKKKRIGDIQGSTRKLYQQKGTGRARAGQVRAIGRRGGAKAHVPVLRNFSIGINRKVRALAMMISIAAKQKEGNLIVFDKLCLETGKTKMLTNALSSHDLVDSLSLFVDDSFDENFYLASRNLQHVTYVPQEKVNVYDIVRREKLVITVSALKKLQERIITQYEHPGKIGALRMGVASVMQHS